MTKKGIAPNVILGVSNPLLACNFKDLPNQLRLDQQYYSDRNKENPKLIPIQSLKDISKAYNTSSIALKSQDKLLVPPQSFVF
jgi:hypothetical protein